MKLYENFYCLVEVVCEHWYYGTEYKQFVICYEDDELFDETTESFQKIANFVLDKVDKRRMFEDYSIKLKFCFDNSVEEIELSEQFIQNWKDDNIPYKR